MNTLKEEYEKITIERKIVLDEIKELSENEIVKKYFDLCKKNNNLATEQMELYTDIKTDEFLNCNHIWVNTLKDYDSYEGRTETYCGCIKCGLDERVLYLMEYNPDYHALTQEQQIMNDIMQNNYYNRGIHTNIFCNLDLAKAIYKRILETHPNISDSLARKYFEIALDNIRNIKVSDERKENRAKRLSLNKDFNKWN